MTLNWRVFELRVMLVSKLYCFHYIWTWVVVITMLNSDVCELFVNLLYHVTCMLNHVRSWLYLAMIRDPSWYSTDYRVYMSSSVCVSTCKQGPSCLILYKLVGSVIAGLWSSVSHHTGLNAGLLARSHPSLHRLPRPATPLVTSCSASLPCSCLHRHRSPSDLAVGASTILPTLASLPEVVLASSLDLTPPCFCFLAWSCHALSAPMTSSSHLRCLARSVETKPCERVGFSRQCGPREGGRAQKGQNPVSCACDGEGHRRAESHRVRQLGWAMDQTKNGLDKKKSRNWYNIIYRYRF
jgi:hypothetical protein